MGKPKQRKYLYRKKPYVYFRNPNTGQLTRLPSDEGSVEFEHQYSTLLAALSASPTPPRDPNVRVKRNYGDGGAAFTPPTLGWFIEQWLKSEKFNPDSPKAYAKGTRANYRRSSDILKAKLGRGVFADLDQEAVEVYTAEIARVHGPSCGDDQIALISNLWNFAKGFREFKRHGRMNPTYRITRHYEHDGEGHLVWPDEVIEQFDQTAKPHLALVRMGLHYTGQRGGDVVNMKWTDFDDEGEAIFVVQEKTGKKLWLQCPKPLLKVLRAERQRSNHEHIFLHAMGDRFANSQTLSHAIHNHLHAIGCKDYVMHGLRKNAGTELAMAGCSVEEIMAVLGHKTPKMAMFYCQQAQQRVLNVNAVNKWDAYIEARTTAKIAARRRAMYVVPERTKGGNGAA